VLEEEKKPTKKIISHEGIIRVISFDKKKVDGKERVIFPEISKDSNGNVIERYPDQLQQEIFEKLNEDDWKIIILKDLSYEPREMSEEEIIEEETCHGKAMGCYEEQEDMLGGCVSLKAVLDKSKEKTNEVAPFIEKKQKL
jgi:hypothetical protein